MGESNSLIKFDVLAPIEVDTFDGKFHVEWDLNAKLTSLGQLPFFIQFLNLGKRLEP
jgi:hypothetical protein